MFSQTMKITGLFDVLILSAGCANTDQVPMLAKAKNTPTTKDVTGVPIITTTPEDT
jgi:hypothetical protein